MSSTFRLPVSTSYTHDFYAGIQKSASQSAGGLVPILMRLIKPESLLDVGCGTGDWLAAFRDRDVSDVFGVDGDFVERSLINLPRDRFKAVDLNTPFDRGRQFDPVLGSR